MTIDQDDQDMYDEVRAAFTDVHAATGPEAVSARGRTLKRRRWTTPALALAAVAAVSLSVNLTAGGGQANAGLKTDPVVVGSTGTATTAKPNLVALNVDNAAFSVHANAQSGVVTVTLRQVLHASSLQHVLESGGIDADVQVYHIKLTGAPRQRLLPECIPANGAHSIRATGAISVYAYPTNKFSFDPARLPSGSVLGIGLYWAGDMNQPALSLSVFSTNPGACVVPNGRTDITTIST